MCKWGNYEYVKLKIPADLSCKGIIVWKWVKIDKCIAPIVRALQEGNIDMRGSCCGHGKSFGEIQLQDGRILLIINSREWYNNRLFFLFKLFLKELIKKVKKLVFLIILHS